VLTGIALVTGGEDRQWLYPAMTRGTDAKLACGRADRIGDVEGLRRAFRAAMNEHRGLAPSQEAARDGSKAASSGLHAPWRDAPWRDAIPQPPRPHITHRRRSFSSPPSMTSISNPRPEANPRHVAPGGRRVAPRSAWRLAWEKDINTINV
jgi:hypothetical protein